MPLIYVHEASLPERKARTIQVVNTCVSLASLGIDVELVVENCVGQGPTEIASFYGLRWPANMKISASSGRGVLRAVRTAIHAKPAGSTTIFCRNLKTTRMLLPLSKSMGIPLIYEAHKIAFMVVSDEARLAKLSARRVRRRALRTFKAESEVFRDARGVVCTTEAGAALARTLFGRERDVIVARNGGPELIPRTEHKNPESSGDEVPGGKRVVYVGRLGGWKGTDTLFGAMRQLDGFHLTVVGGSAEGKSACLSDASETFSLPEEQLLLRDYLSPADVMPFLCSQSFVAAAITLPARHSSEPFFFTCPLKLFQYLAAGIPVVASDIPALREILRHRQNAYLVEPNDPAALAEGIKTVAFDTQLAVTLRNNGYETARRHTWRMRASRLASFLRDITRSCR